MPLHLRPIMSDIVEVLGVGGDLLEDGPTLLARGQILFLLVFATARVDQAVLPQNALDGHVAERKIPLAHLRRWAPKVGSRRRNSTTFWASSPPIL